MAGTKRRANGAPSAAAGAGAGAGAATFRSGSRSLDAVASAAAAPSQLAEASTSRRRLNGMQEESSSGARNAEESDTEIGPGGSFSSANGGSSDDGGSDDFDDDVDLIAAATATRSGAASSNDDDDDDDEGREREPVSEEWDHAMYSDEDMEGGFEDVDGSRPADEAKEEGARSNRAGPPQGKKASLYAVPSRDEMNQLKNTSELYKSNIFKLKIEQMLSEVRPRYEKSGALDFVLRRLKATLESITPIKAQPLPGALKHLASSCKGTEVKVPFPHPLPKQDSLIKYGVEQPARIQVVGSWILKTAALRPGGVDVDLVVTMPSILFQEKDHLNMRYFHKRAFYLAAVAAAVVNDQSISVDASYKATNEDPRRPHLVLKSKRNGSAADFSKTKTHIRIHLAHEEGLFAPGRLAPDRNNMRLGQSSEEEKDQQPATPHYNASILADSLYARHLLYINSVNAKCNDFGEALMLLKTWASQRSFGTGPNKNEVKNPTEHHNGRRVAFGSDSARFLLTMVLAHLLNGPDRNALGKSAYSGSSGASKLSPGFSSFQLFRGVLDFVASHDFTAQPIFMKATKDISSNRDKIGMQVFVDYFDHVLVDPTGSVNLLGNMTPGTLRYMQQQAAATVAMLGETDKDYFDEIFLRDQSKPAFHFDDVIRLSMKHLSMNDPAMRNDYGSPINAGIVKVARILTRGLSDRHLFLAPFMPCELEWAVCGAQPHPRSTVEIGLVLDPAHAFRLVDHGPRPEDSQAADAFKSFWGELSELRRFRDGRIVESVVWEAKGPLERLTIPRRIVQHLIDRHFGVTLADKHFYASAFEQLLLPSTSLAQRAYVAHPREIGFQGVQSSFEQMTKTLRGLEGLPLTLISVAPADAGLRRSITACPAPFNMSGAIPFAASYLPVQEFVMTFESSGQWPDDVVAIQAMKMAFYEHIAAKLVEVEPDNRAAIVMDVDADSNKSWDAAALEIISPSGFAFRGRIHHERERVLLQRILADKDEDGFERSQARAALSRFEARFVHAVRHHSHMSALVSRFPSLGDAVRLAKRWISSQLLGQHVPQNLIELIGASVYVGASAGSAAPATGHAGFSRIVKRLADWQWRDEPLAVPMASATSATPLPRMDVQTRQSIDANFAHMRRLDPGLHHFAWFIATEDEPKGTCWANDTPSGATADALQRLARGAVRILEAGPLLEAAHIKALFIPSFAHFDFLVHLEPAAVTRYIDALDSSDDALRSSEKRMRSATPASDAVPSSSKYRNLSERRDVCADLNTGLQFVQLLESLYLDTFRLYYDPLGGTVIGGLFNPTLTSKARPFRVGLGFNAQPAATAGSKDVVLNQTAVLDEVRRLGAGLVRDVTLQRPQQA